MALNAYVVKATRSAVGKVSKKGGALANEHPISLGAAVLNGLIEQVPASAHKDVDDVIWGCVSQVGSNAGNMGRQTVLSSRLPEHVPGTTVDRQCGSSQQAIHFAAQAVMSGTQDIVVAGGCESMTRVPMFSNFAGGKLGNPNNGIIQEKYNTDQAFFSQFVSAEMMGVKYGISREDMDAFAARSHQRAAAAQTAGLFQRQITPIATSTGDVHSVDEGVRGDTTVEGLASLKTLVEMGIAKPVPGGPDGGAITAGNASQMSDGAAAVLLANAAGLEKLGGKDAVRPLARVVSMAVAANDPVLMLSAPIPATQMALAKAGLTLDDIDLYEVNEAFACVPLAWARELGADEDKLNVNGGACALGHPLGATGAKLMTGLVHELQRTGKRYGLLAICEGGGTANATIIERL